MTDLILQTSDHHVETPGGNLFYRRWQSGVPDPGKPVIVLLHDSLGSVELWRDFPAKLVARTGCPALAYDRLGFGESDPHPGKLGSDFIRDEALAGLSAVRNAAGIDRMILLGHSVGGGMAIAAGAALASGVAAVITLSAQAFVEDRTVQGILEAKEAFKDPTQVQRLARYHGAKARWVLDAWIETWLASEFARWSLDGDLRGLRSPLLALHGSRDEYGSEAHPRRIAALAGPSAEAIILEDCGHLPHREQPERVLGLVARFLERLPLL